MKVRSKCGLVLSSVCQRKTGGFASDQGSVSPFVGRDEALMSSRRAFLPPSL